MNMNWTFYEFFAGGGMARAGLGDAWTCVFANDFDKMKAGTYTSNWGTEHFKLGDVAEVKVSELSGRADLVWASFPCQDLSLAGSYRGLGDESSDVLTRSGTFWPFWRLMTQLRAMRRAPRLVVLENVAGAITSQGGRDFEALCNALSTAGYRFGAAIIDAKHFVPQSRPRLFFVAAAADVSIPGRLTLNSPDSIWHPPSLCAAQSRLPSSVRDNWVWWNITPAHGRNLGLADLIEDEPTNCRWHTDAETNKLLGMMNALHLQKIEQARSSEKRCVGAVYKRTRPDEHGVRRQRAEVRFDGIAGCLRTPGGGSSRQVIVVVEGKSVRSRLLSPREAARLMGLSDEYILPARYNDAYHVAGDGVCVPVVRHIAEHLLEPILEFRQHAQRANAA